MNTKEVLYEPNGGRFLDILHTAVQVKSTLPLKFLVNETEVLSEFSRKQIDGKIISGFYTIDKRTFEELTKERFNIDKGSILFWSIILKEID